MREVNPLVLAVVAVAVLGIAMIPTVAATHTQGVIHHTMVDALVPSWVVGELYYRLDVDSHYGSGRYIIDQAWDTVSYSCYWPGVVYTNVVHSYTTYTGIYNEYVWGTCSWENGLSIPTPWGYVWINHYYHTAYLWVYASGYWTGVLY
ncbi:MAG: hypothetical protein HXY34_02460 [Candidatus Thorarchaeota archaeon]|nr:hypothetical protein [Candidatus Thorarchaeota archaeon]